MLWKNPLVSDEKNIPQILCKTPRNIRCNVITTFECEGIPPPSSLSNDTTVQLCNDNILADIFPPHFSPNGTCTLRVRFRRAIRQPTRLVFLVTCPLQENAYEITTDPLTVSYRALAHTGPPIHTIYENAISLCDRLSTQIDTFTHQMRGILEIT